MSFDPVYLDNLPGTADTPKAAVDKLNTNLLAILNAFNDLEDTLDDLVAINFITADQRAALAGTNGAPNAANPYVVDDDPRLLHPDADTENKGIIRLANHLGGSALSPQVLGIKSGSDSLLFGVITEGDMLVRGAGNTVIGAEIPEGIIVPTGTGFRHVVSGSEDSAAKLVENADVHASAAIAETKLALNHATHATTNDPSADEKAALVGSMGTPGAGNKFVTQAHITATPTANRIPIADENGNLDGWITPDLGSMKALRYTIDNANSVIVTGAYPLTIFPLHNGTIVSWALAADAVGSISIEIWKDVFGNVPDSGDKITASAPMALSSAQFLTSTTLTGWTTTVAAWDAFIFNVVSCSTIKRIEIFVLIQVTG
jgi:hypothetical protein